MSIGNEHKFLNALAKTSVGITAGALSIMFASAAALLFTSGPAADIAMKTELVGTVVALSSAPFTGAALGYLFRDLPELISNYPKYMSSINESLSKATNALASLSGEKSAPPRPR